MDSATKQQPFKGNLLIILSVIAILVGLSLLFLQITGANAIRASIEEEELSLAQAQALLQQRLDYQANAPQYREKAAKYQAMIPEQPQEEEILRSLRLVAEEYDLNVQEIRFDARVPNVESGFVQMPMVITVEGSYSSLIQLLDHLQWSGRIYRVDQVNISLAGTDQGGIRAVLTASVFYRIVN
jgi:Tfp pilus assembly protein PilO